VLSDLANIKVNGNFSYYRSILDAVESAQKKAAVDINLANTRYKEAIAKVKSEAIWKKSMYKKSQSDRKKLLEKLQEIEYESQQKISAYEDEFTKFRYSREQILKQTMEYIVIKAKSS
jgi:folate-dependent phosphoribosylglycinamide formyltransferase PurN